MTAYSESELRDLAGAWLAYQARCDAAGKVSVPGWDAWDAVAHLVWDHPETGWRVILLLVEMASTDSQLGDVAAGPLEDLLRDHASRFIDRVEEAARRNAKFRKCLKGVWAWSSLSDEIKSRLEKFGWEDESSSRRTTR